MIRGLFPTTRRNPLVLVPGLLCDALVWSAQIADLGALADCWVADPRGPETMAALAGKVLNEAPFDRFALAGLSMGGYVALEMMRQAPGRIERLALLDTSARPDTAEQSARRLDFIQLAERGRFIGVSEALLPSLVHHDRLEDEALICTIKTMARNTGRRAFSTQERAIMSRQDSRPLLPSIACPTLVLCGRDDKLTPPALHEEIAAGIPGSTLQVIDDCGHLSTLEQPAEVSRALRAWLGADRSD